MDFEDILSELGGYGKFQKGLVWGYLFPATALLSWFTMSQIFMLSPPAHQCVLPYVNYSSFSEDQILNLTSVFVSKDNCRRYEDPSLTTAADFSQLLAINANDSSRWVSCEEFTFDKTLYETNAVSKWNLVCDRSPLPSLVYTLGNVGMAVGTLTFGTLADKFGRKITFFITVIIIIVSGISSVLVENFYAFLALRFLNSTVMPSIFQIPYIILVEIVGPDQRTNMLFIGCFAWTLGISALPFLAMWTRTFVVLGVSTTSLAIPYFLYWWFLPESPRWLLSQNRLEETSKILKKVGRKNGVEDIPDLELKLKKAQNKIMEEKKQAASASVFELLRQPRMRKHFLIIAAAWIANGATYYGLQINVSNLSGNEFFNFFYLSLVEIPAYISGWFFMGKFGRRWSSVAFQLFAGIFCFLPVVITNEMIGIIASLVTKYASSAALMMMYQQASELMPTPLRSVTLGAASASSSFFQIGIPYVIYLSKYGKWIPFFILSIMIMIAGISSAWLPETLGYNLCQTVEDAEDFGSRQKFFAMNLRRESQIHSPLRKKEAAQNGTKSEKEPLEAVSEC